MSDRSTIGGTAIKLRALFKDDLGDVATANDIYVHIFEPGEDTTDLNNATVVSGIPLSLGEGIYEYEYTPPFSGPEGAWIDQWIGTINGNEVTANFTFTVSAGGTVSSLDTQLFENDVVQVTIPSGIISADGNSTLDEPYEFEFMTVTTPSYTNIRKVRLEVGGFIKDLPEDTIQTSILEASLEADIMTFTKVRANTSLFQHARREFVTCLAAGDLVDNLSSGGLKSKTLGDLSVQYDTGTIRDILDKLSECMAKWTPQLISGGGAKASRSPKMIVKGSKDPDRPLFARSWERTDFATSPSQATPAANTTLKRRGLRRGERSYYNRLSRRYKWW